MHVVVAFSPNYGTADAPELGNAFWLVESPANRAIAEQKWKAKSTDPNSAILKSGDAPDVEGMFATVDLHHPNWSRVDFIGASLTNGLEYLFRDAGFQIAELPSGFALTRQVL
ncbi:hypothetical protein ASG17_03375 [Brevundimonas sp. Leaf363]|nr:hypothetical protein ASG17_03375 [Brevundimonas sp. Leaf363]